MPQLGRYIIESPKPPGAIQQFRGNINRLGGAYLQKQMAERQRQQELEDAITLAREKAQIEQELDPMAGILKGGQGVDALSKMAAASTDPQQKAVLGQLASQISDRMAGRYAPTAPTPDQTDDQTDTINLKQMDTMEKPVFGMSRTEPTHEEIIAGQSLAPSSMIREKTTTEMTPFGVEEEKGSTFFNPQADIAKKQAEFKAKVGESKISNIYNLNLVADTARDLSDWLVAGYKEGGAGDIYRAIGTKAARSGLLPQDIPFAKRFTESRAMSGGIVGKRNEMLMKMFPMLTQQLGKEGSIRLIESVLERIGQTLPDTETPPAMAGPQLAGTLQSMYRIQRALENIDINSYDFNNPTDFNRFQNDTIAMTSRIQISPEEEKILGNFINTAIQPLVEYTGKPFSSGGQQPQQPVFGGQRQTTMSVQPNIQEQGALEFSSEEEAMRAGLKPGTIITINGRRAIWE